ncbi:hypothetical protein BU16DRAFT_528545 [Lophium mytilinum]|uniref:60S ribosomal protein L20 n=1 Tax=Lophium mytilinum TaxID=390894 RepID=A0A6A6QLU2_9PEZI|nr:hypothetical protein BU16DRAFT_528545 [Lophium mytilinum]
MSALPLTRPMRPLSTKSAPLFLPHLTTRHASSTRRHKKLNIISPAPSYNLSAAPNSTTHSRSAKPSPRAPSATHIIFNPPSAAPSPTITPPKFLPASDPRRALYSSFTAASTRSALQSRTPLIAATGTSLSSPSLLPARPSANLPPPVRGSGTYEKKYHLTDADIAEIRKLRTEDPYTWTRWRLAEKFGCSQFFVSLVVKAPEKAAEVEASHQAARDRWGNRKRMADEDRKRRVASWGR